MKFLFKNKIKIKIHVPLIVFAKFPNDRELGNTQLRVLEF